MTSSLTVSSPVLGSTFASTGWPLVGAGNSASSARAAGALPKRPVPATVSRPAAAMPAVNVLRSMQIGSMFLLLDCPLHICGSPRRPRFPAQGRLGTLRRMCAHAVAHLDALSQKCFLSASKRCCYIAKSSACLAQLSISNSLPHCYYCNLFVLVGILNQIQRV